MILTKCSSAFRFAANMLIQVNNSDKRCNVRHICRFLVNNTWYNLAFKAVTELHSVPVYPSDRFFPLLLAVLNLRHPSKIHPVTQK